MTRVGSRKRRSGGFTLLELMIVVAVLAIIVALAIPAYSHAKRSANEASAIAAMRMFTQTQIQYRMRYAGYGGVLDLEAVGMIERSRGRYLDDRGEFDELASEAYLRHGELDQARTHAERALELAETRRSSTLRAGGLLSLARIELCTGAAARARELLDEALRCADEAHAGARVPFLRYECAQAARALGDDTARARELREAQRLFAEMGATGRAEWVARELGS